MTTDLYFTQIYPTNLENYLDYQIIKTFKVGLYTEQITVNLHQNGIKGLTNSFQLLQPFTGRAEENC